ATAVPNEPAPITTARLVPGAGRWKCGRRSGGMAARDYVRRGSGGAAGPDALLFVWRLRFIGVRFAVAVLALDCLGERVRRLRELPERVGDGGGVRAGDRPV